MQACMLPGTETSGEGNGVTGPWHQIPVGARRRPWIWEQGWISFQEQPGKSRVFCVSSRWQRLGWGGLSPTDMQALPQLATEGPPHLPLHLLHPQCPGLGVLLGGRRLFSGGGKLLRWLHLLC